MRPGAGMADASFIATLRSWGHLVATGMVAAGGAAVSPSIGAGPVPRRSAGTISVPEEVRALLDRRGANEGRVGRHLRERRDGRAVQYGAVDVAAGAVARTVPGLLPAVPRDHAPEVRTDRGSRV